MNKIAAYAPLLEKIFLSGVLLGAVLSLLHVATFDTTVIVVSLYGLGVAYYFSAFRRFETPESELNAANEPTSSGELKSTGFHELLAFLILPKVLWLSSAISVIGLAMLVMGTQPQGYVKMLLIGGLTIASGLAILVILLLRGTSMKPLTPVLFRAIPLLMADVYLYTRHV